ncbi:MAG: hypothetical protein VXU46_00845, partial [Planctomycetota bacterium]|nr:hypothetical protein [Planctomycetota bacterium]
MAGESPLSSAVAADEVLPFDFTGTRTRPIDVILKGLTLVWGWWQGQALNNAEHRIPSLHCNMRRLHIPLAEVECYLLLVLDERRLALPHVSLQTSVIWSHAAQRFYNSKPKT